MIIQRFVRFVTHFRPNSYANKFVFSNKKEEDYGIKFNEEQIRNKMKEIKQKKETKTKKQAKIEFMNINTNLELARKIKKYRQSTGTENLLHFTDVTTQEKPTTLQITGYDQRSIEVDNMSYPHSLILFPKQVFVWEVLDVQNLTLDDFIILKYISPKPTYVVVGVSNPQKFPKDIAQYLRSKYQDFDILELFEATSQYNTTASDDINVVAFIISK